MTHEELLAQARKHIWAAWTLSSEELASQAVETLIGLGMLVEEGGARQLEKLRGRVAEMEAALAGVIAADEELNTAVVPVVELRAQRAALIAMLPKRPLPAVMLGEGPALRAAWAVWEKVAAVLDVELPATPGQSVEESAARWTRFFAPTQALREDQHDSPLHHDYQLGRDLPLAGEGS